MKERRSVILTKDLNGRVNYRLKQGVVFSIESDSSTITELVHKIEIGDKLWESHGKKSYNMTYEELQLLSQMVKDIRSSNEDIALTLHLPTGNIQDEIFIKVSGYKTSSVVIR